MKMQIEEKQKREYLKRNDSDFDFSYVAIKPCFNEKIKSMIKENKKKFDLILLNGMLAFCASNTGFTLNGQNAEELQLDKKQSFDEHYFGDKKENNQTIVFEFSQTTKKQLSILNIMSGTICLNYQYLVKENVAVKLFEKFVSFEKANLNLVCQINTQKNSTLNMTILQNLQSEKSIFSCQSNVMGKFKRSIVNLSSGKVVNDNKVFLKHQEADASVQNSTFANGQDEMPIYCEMIHEKERTNSLIQNFAFVNDNAMVSANGVNVILNGKKKSNARQETKMFGLTKQAKCVANPLLVIDEFDVKASHAAAVGKLDEDAIYYLMSRGITRTHAKQMIILALVSHILNEIENEQEKEDLTVTLEQKIKE